LKIVERNKVNIDKNKGMFVKFSTRQGHEHFWMKSFLVNRPSGLLSETVLASQSPLVKIVVDEILQELAINTCTTLVSVEPKLPLAARDRILQVPMK
jgi:hypothetical protein